MICLDATHCISHIQRAIMYTVVVRHPITGTECPVAYMSTKDHSMDPVASFFLLLKDVIELITLTKITIDVSLTEHAAITRIYPQATV
ncbi:hypothetical protein EDC96DRAFT_492358 [Choanephora cucurbitarum]|nr:hypothetical protein EDC96DRAFT_492358 [Choanephora cucurbitarum]